MEGSQDFVIDAAHLKRQREWSGRTFGPGTREAGVIDHIRKELREIDDAGAGAEKLSEWIDVVILALDGAWRCGADPQEILDAIHDKQVRNEARVWPDWRTSPAGKAIEHDRSFDTALGGSQAKGSELMAKYRKKPVVIEAVEWTGKNPEAIYEFLKDDALAGHHYDYARGGYVIKTLEGEHLASPGDFIIKGVKGEFYLCKPDIFEATYEALASEPTRDEERTDNGHQRRA